jgi:predicted XRE-type DNA-binding protein
MNRDRKAKPTITASSGNVFLDVGLHESEAKLHKMRADLMVEIEKQLKAKRLTQTKAAEVLHVSQARISDLIRGKTEKFSLDMLVTFLNRMGKSVDIKVVA